MWSLDVTWGLAVSAPAVVAPPLKPLVNWGCSVLAIVVMCFLGVDIYISISGEMM